MSSLLRPGRVCCALLLACVFAALPAAPASAASAASAAVPCWKTLLNDWYDGTINNIYPIPCYHQAIAHLPLDVETYSSAKDDILNAMAQAIRQQKNHTVTNVETNAVTSPGRATTTTGATTTTAVPTTTKKKSGLPLAIQKITPGGADAFPLPLLILGLLAILLVLTGVGGMLWRRYQGRSETP